MPELKIKCPKCGHVTGTGISMDKKSFETSTLLNNTGKCQKCGKMITWSKKDVLPESFK